MGQTYIRSDASMREWTIGIGLPLSLATFNSATTRSSFLFACAESNRRLYCDISISDVSHKLSTWTYCEYVCQPQIPSFPTVHSAHCTVSVSNTNAQFFKDAFFLCSPIVLTAFFQDTIVFLSIRPTFYGKNGVMFMCDADDGSWSVKRWLKYCSKMCY
jgi:hypothetical protein